MRVTKEHLVHMVRAEVRRATHREYRIKFDALDGDSLMELRRLLTDLQYEKLAEVRRARLQPWRHR